MLLYFIAYSDWRFVVDSLVRPILGFIICRTISHIHCMLSFYYFLFLGSNTLQLIDFLSDCAYFPILTSLCVWHIKFLGISARNAVII